jgi:UDP-2-acetamido-2,6-beta-L-arabino-hexul-4-ose reductase
LSIVRVAITGAHGFIGRNLQVSLQESKRFDVAMVTRTTTDAERQAIFAASDAVVHLAGVNRPLDVAEFAVGNVDLTTAICNELRADARAIPVVYASSTQATLDNPYGRSKRDAESALLGYAADTGAGVAILRLPNVFGKWARPNYNSAVATFCHHIARGLPVHVHDATAALHLVYVDDVVETIVALLDGGVAGTGLVPVGPVHATTVGAVADAIQRFADSRESLDMPPVGTGLMRALYATYVSALPVERFAYALRRHEDPRGVFAEMLRTTDSGQFSFFSAHPGVTRGGHYHHTKTEKFLVVQGVARFGFRHVVSGDRHEIVVDGRESRVVETVPGWVHDITNIGTDEMIVLLWANEVFDPLRPDTIAARVAE